MFCKSIYECRSFRTARQPAYSLGTARATCRVGWTTLAVVAALLVVFEENANAIAIDIDPVRLAEAGLSVASESHESRPAQLTQSRLLRCRPLVPPPEHCFRRARRNFDCCARGGASGSAGSSDFAQSDLGVLGATGGAQGSGGGGGGGGGSGGTGSSSSSIVDPGPMPPPVSSVPGPSAGAGLPGLLLFVCTLFVLWNRRSSPAGTSTTREQESRRITRPEPS
jgi:uncharacterized membrane protein YgcG